MNQRFCESVFSTLQFKISDMIVKEVICVLLISGSLEIFAFDNGDKISELNSHELRSKQIKYLESHEAEREKKLKDVAQQFEKDYHKWGKKYTKQDSKEFADSNEKINLKINEINSKEYVEKYNKYGKTFNPNLLHTEKYDSSYSKKRDSENKNYPHEHEKPGSLLHDINVNYINNNKEISGDSELISENVAPKNKESYQENYQNGNELYMKRFKKNFYENLINIDIISPPPANDTILMARYIVHTVDWAALATLSGRTATKGSPFVCVKATSDGIKNSSSGIPFFYMSPMDLCTQDLQKDNRVSVLVTLSETEYCKNQNLDPQDPRCAKLTLSGKIKRIKHGSEEEKFAKNALFSRHPAMESWPTDHNWYFTKLKIGQIILLDQFGGATYIKVKDYLNGKIVEPELRK